MNHTLSAPLTVRRLALTSLLLLSSLPVTAQRQRLPGNPFQPPTAKTYYARSHEFDFQHLRLVFDIEPATHSAKGVVTHTLTPLFSNLNSITLDAGTSLTIQGCRVNDVECKFTHEDGKLRVAITPLPAGKPATLEIRYTMGNAERRGGANGLGGFHWINADPENPERTPGFWTQGESETNRNWVPCFDFPNDFVTSETIVTVPENWQVIGNGRDMGSTHNSDKHTRTFHWKMTQPHATYLLSLAGGELDIKKTVWQGVPLYYVVPKGKAYTIEGSFGNTPDMLSFFSKILGVKYAWPKYAQNAMFDFGGGMENVSATTLGQNSLTDLRSGNYGMSSLNSHELAHQWFGDLVTCEDWGDVWLNESFATYFQQLYTEHFFGKDRFDSEREGSLRAYLGESRRYKRPLSTRFYPAPDAMFDSHTYPKGGLILHMLRRELGDDYFFKGLNHYLTMNRHKPVDANSLARAFNQATPVNVKPFFDQWMFAPGHPVIETKWSYDDAKKLVHVTVKQTQDTKEGTPLYTLPISFGLMRSGTSSSTATGFTLNAAEQEFVIPSDTKPAAVLIDPAHDLLMERKGSTWSEEESAAILRNAPNIVDRRAALNILVPDAEKMSDTTLTLLQEVLHATPSDSLGAALLQKLGDAKKEALRPLFLKEIAGKEPERRAAALSGLAKLPLTPESVALFSQIGLSDRELYQNVETSLRALGTEAEKHLDVYRHQVGAHSHRDRLASVVVDTLSNVKQEAAALVLLLATKSGHLPTVRRTAIRTLGSFAPGSVPVRQALLELIKEEEHPSVQEAAIKALEERKEKETVSALRSLAASSKTPKVRDSAKEAADTIEGK